LAADAGGWIRVLQLLAETEALRMRLGQAGRARAVENYSVARWGDEWLAVLSEISR
jgi:glycosyltransferase involved in cell wall biosynthesis